MEYCYTLTVALIYLHPVKLLPDVDESLPLFGELPSCNSGVYKAQVCTADINQHLGQFNCIHWGTTQLDTAAISTQFCFTAIL